MKRILFFVCFIVCISLTACKGEYVEENFFCMDTLATINADTDNFDSIKKCRELLTSLNTTLSRHSENGQTAKYNASENGIEVSDDIKNIITTAEVITENTDGAFSVFAGGLTALWEKSTRHPSDAEIKKALDSIQTNAVFNGNFLEKNNENALLEFGGIAKGYACDKAVALLKNEGVTSGMVSFSSSIGVFGESPDGEPWKIAIKDPADTDRVMGYVSLNDGYLSVSGDYERFYEIDGKKYNHIIDTKTGLPVDNGVHSVIVVANTGAESDALSTAFFVMGADEVEEEYAGSREVKYLIVTEDGIFMNDAMKEIYTAKTK